MNEDCMRLAVCDDDASDRSRIQSEAYAIADEEGFRCDIVCFDNGAELLAAIRAGEQYHALLLDVMMPGMTGMELAAALRARQDETAIVFISSNREMALCGYEVAAARFLAKPMDREKLREALLFCCRRSEGRAEITLPTARGTRGFTLSEIVYAETWGRGLRLVLQDGEEEVGMKISELEAMLPPRRFVLCHRAFLVNLEYVQYLRYCEIELKTGGVLPVSKYRQNATRERLMLYLEG